MDKDIHFLQWHIIHECNLRCIHCYQDETKCLMSLDDMIKVLDKYEYYLNTYNYEGQINLTGGEPILHPDFFNIANEIVKRGIKLGVLTNGTLIDDNIANKLAKLHPIFVQVSLDGTSNIHDKIRGKGNFYKAIEGIDALKRVGVKVLVSFTVMKDNYLSMEELAQVCMDHNVDKLWWDRVVTDDEKLYLTTEEFKTVVKQAKKLKKKYPFVSNERALQGLLSKECGYTCNAGKRLLIILANGDMMACRRLPFVIGNVYDDMKIEEIIRKSPIMNRLALPIIPDECKKCSHALWCKGGAKCVTYAQTKELGIKDINCFKML